MAIDKVRKELHKLVDEAQNEDFLKAMMLTFEAQIQDAATDYWDILPQAAKDDIAAGLKDIEEGRVHTDEEVKKYIKDELGLDL